MPLTTGQVLNNRYRIVKLLGEGGFGAVYRAWDLNLNGPCAIKENFDTSPEARQQFAREASLLFNLRHPNLPKVFDSFSIPGQGQYLAMEYIEGEDLGQILERAGGALPEAQVLEWISQICDALIYLHSQNPPIVHRDIKPANIRVTPQKQCFLVDFGIAKVYDPQLKTTLGARAVSSGYSPPEQYGQGKTDEQTDIYALGATLYALLTGKVPPDSLSISTAENAQILPAKSVNPAISAHVSAAISRAMQLDKKLRFRTMREFKAALLNPATPAKPAVPIQPTVVVPEVPPYREIPPHKPATVAEATAARPLLPLALGGLALLALMIIGVCATLLYFTVINPAGGKGFGEISFCSKVTEDGQCIGAATDFPAGSTEVWAKFTFKGMKKGQVWGRLWQHNDTTYNDTRGETWEHGKDGWIAYSVYNSDNIPLSGKYTLTLYLDDEAVQTASFEVAAPEIVSEPGPPSFGPIQFARGVTEATTPVEADTQFEAGIKEVYAIFPYTDMTDGQPWKRVWTQNGEIIAESDDLTWDEGAEGVTYAYLSSDEGLDAGSYTLNLYIDNKLARSGDFEIVSAAPAEIAPAKPEEIIDADLMPAWEILYNATDEYSFLHNTAQFALDHWVEIRMDESYSGTSLAAYSYDKDSCQPNYAPGMVLVYRQTWNESSWEELAGILAHELTHAMQHYDGNYRCPGCSVYKEYHAFIAQFYTWMMIGRQDLIEKYPVWNSSGRFDADLLWQYVSDLYGDSCPEY